MMEATGNDPGYMSIEFAAELEKTDQAFLAVFTEILGFRVVALAQWSTKRIGGKTRWVKFSLWCPVCGFKLTREGKKLQLETLVKLMG